MIIPYASDEENDTTTDGQDIPSPHLKGKAQPGDASEEYVKEKNIFAYDKIFENSSGNESDAQFLKKFEYLKIHDIDHPRFNDDESLLSNQSISKRENQFLNKEVLNILNASLEIKKNLLNKTNNKSNSNKNENSYNEISSIAQGSSNTEFSQTDFSIAMDKKERELLYNCMHNKNSQSREMHNNNKKEMKISRDSNDNNIEKSKNQSNSKDEDPNLNGEKYSYNTNIEMKNRQEEPFNIINKTNEHKETFLKKKSSNNSKSSNDKINFNLGCSKQNYNMNSNNPVNNFECTNTNNYLNINNREKNPSKKNRKSKKDKKYERESQSKISKEQDHNVNQLTSSKYQNNLNEHLNQQDLIYYCPMNNQNNCFSNQNANAFMNNKIYSNTPNFNHQMMQNHFQQNQSNNKNHNNNLNNNQMFINPCYVYNKNMNGQQVPFAINMPFNQYRQIPAPYNNMMNNSNYYYNCPSGFNDKNGNHIIYHNENTKINPNLSNFENSNRILSNQNNNQNFNNLNSCSNNIPPNFKHVQKSPIATITENSQGEKKQKKNKKSNFTSSQNLNNRKLNQSVKQESEEESEHPINQIKWHNLPQEHFINCFESKNHKLSKDSSGERQSIDKSNELNSKYLNFPESSLFNINASHDLTGDSTFVSFQSNIDISNNHFTNQTITNGNCDINMIRNNHNNYNFNNKEKGSDESIKFDGNNCHQSNHKSANYLDNDRGDYYPNNNQNFNNKNKPDAISDESFEEEYDEIKENEHIMDLISKKNFSDINESDLLSNLLSIAKDQTGCRFLQHKIDENPNFANFDLYSEIQLNIGDYICDPYGNYLVQKMLDSLTTDKINLLTSNLASNFYFYATNPHATRIIQKLLDIIQNNKHIHTSKLFEEIKKHTLDLFKDINGIHVIQKIIKNIPTLKNYVYNVSEQNLVAIATNKHGCCALQKCLELADKTNKGSLINLIIKNSIILMSDQFGNYVIQFVISLREQKYIGAIINTFKDNIEYLSKQKYASNVIEKCFDNCSEENKFALVYELAKPNIISELIVNNYGNFVLQKAMKNCSNPYYSIFITVIGQNLYKLKKFQWGPKLYNKILDNFSELQAYVTKPKQKC